ncbi:hypothetical protein JB92DRAFT_3136146 [Gautieria morchelliformis]|nr:hypothetical protein JB92DRAFT_3136146 [Gautieria morchelliformis]
MTSQDLRRGPTLDRLPEDIILCVLSYLNITSISSLSKTCRVLHAIVEDSGWKVYALEHPLPSQSLTPALNYSLWSMRDLVRHQKLAHTAWKRRQFVSRPLGPEWSSKFHSVMAISSSRLVVAAGNTLYCYKFTPPTSRHSEAPRVIFEYVVTFPKDARRDISGIAFEHDGQGVILSSFHGALGRISLPQSSSRKHWSVRAPDLLYFQRQGRPIRSMSVASNTVLTIDSVGLASMYSLADPDRSLLSSFAVGGSLPATGWATHLSLRSSSGFAVFGTSSATPLVAHGVTESGISAYPQAILSLSGKPSTTAIRRAVYSITGTSPRTFPWASSSDQIIISGWYHGIISLHDLRCPAHSDSLGRGPILPPVQTMKDPLMLSPIYSLSSAGAHIAAGSARSSVVHLYDVRSPKTGWSIYLPQEYGRPTSSPVYSCLLESTRLWAATESRPFVVDFGEVHERTFPRVTERNVMKGTTGSLGWFAPVCEHSMFSR